MKPKTLIHSGLAILIGASVGIVNVPNLLYSGKITQTAIAGEAYPQADENGDYYIVNGSDSYMPYEWEVVDTDPNGLNCRYANRRRKNGTNGRDIYNFPVGRTFLAGTRISSASINSDDRGLPWLWIGSSFTSEICYVRANSRFVRPIRPLPKPF